MKIITELVYEEKPDQNQRNDVEATTIPYGLWTIGKVIEIRPELEVPIAIVEIMNVDETSFFKVAERKLNDIVLTKGSTHVWKIGEVLSTRFESLDAENELNTVTLKFTLLSL